MSILSLLFPWSRRAPLIGIDISADGIRLVQLSGTRDKLRVDHFAFEPLTQGVVREGGVQDFDQVCEALHIAIVKSGSPTQQVALALPASSVISKVVTLPELLSEEDIEAEIQTEASQNLPFPLSEMGLDFYILGPSKREPASVDVMLVAARKEKIDERLALAQAVGVEAVVMNVDVYAARWAMAERIKREKQGRNNVIGLYQIGLEQSHFSVLDNSMAIYERELGIGSQKLKQDLERTANEMHDEVIQPFNALLAQELSRSLQLFFSSSTYSQIERLYLAGDDYHLAQLATALSQRIDVPVLQANPYTGMKFSSRINLSALEAQAPASLVAVGLALSGLEK